VLCGSAFRVHAPKLLPSISLGARARRRGLRRFFEGRFLRAKNHALGAGRTGPHLKEIVRNFMFFMVFLSIQEVNSTVRSTPLHCDSHGSTYSDDFAVMKIALNARENSDKVVLDGLTPGKRATTLWSKLARFVPKKWDPKLFRAKVALSRRVFLLRKSFASQKWLPFRDHHCLVLRLTQSTR